MTLTEEQKERMQKNRERALEIQQRKRVEELEKNALEERGKQNVGGRSKRRKVEVENQNQEENELDGDLEEFEEGASELVAKGEAKKMYCLPEGSLDVCKVVEKVNPRHKAWAPMKLYYRSELRRRARKRFGGKEGLIAERRRREEERFLKDVEKTKNIFKK